jgi:4-hydroxybenzoate polyprenyltransferase
MNARMRSLAARLDAYERLVRLDRPIGILLLLWPTLWALWLARHVERWLGGRQEFVRA